MTTKNKSNHYSILTTQDMFDWGVRQHYPLDFETSVYTYTKKQQAAFNAGSKEGRLRRLIKK